MLNKVQCEAELYAGMGRWLENRLKDKYRNVDCDVFVEDCHSNYLDSILEKHGVIKYFPQLVGVKIEIDVLGIVRQKEKADIFLIEAKKNALTLQNLGQLLVYAKLCDPKEAYLLSPRGLGSLEKVFTHLNREDLLDYGAGGKIKKICVAKWNIEKEGIDMLTVLPKI